MTARRVFLVVLMVALSTGGMVTSGYAWSRSDCDGRASDYEGQKDSIFSKDGIFGCGDSTSVVEG